MKKDLIIFGTGKIAEVVYYYAKEECEYNVVAFTTDAKYITENSFLGLPVVSFEEVDKLYDINTHQMFVAVGYHDLNRLREKKVNEAISKGYELISIISSNTHLPKNVSVGVNCFIMPPAIIHPCVKIGNNVFIWSGAMVGHHSNIGDHNWITSCANIGGNVALGNNCFIAMGATLGHGVQLGNNCFIGANTLTTKNLEDKTVVINESTKPFRLNSDQFLRFSNFSNL